MGDRIQLRRGTTEEWVFANPILQAGEPGYETSTQKIKLGNGVSRWSELLYLEADADSVSWSEVYGKPSAFPPSSHASSHASNGSDALTPSDIGAAPAASPAFTGVVTVSAGTAAAPAIISGTGTSDTGVFWPAADTFAISTAGTERLRVGATGLTVPDSYQSSTGPVYGIYSAINKSATNSATFAFLAGGNAPSQFNGQILAASSGAATPAIANRTDTTTGVDIQVGAIVIATAGSERLRVRADGNVGIGFAGYGTAKAAVAGAVTQSGGAYPAAVYDACVFYSDPAQGTKNAWAFWSASAPAESQGFSNFGHFLASCVAPSDTSNHYGFFSVVSGATNNYAFFANNAAATGSFNFYASGNATNYFAGNVGIGASRTTPASALDVNGVITVSAGTAAAPAIISGTGTSDTGVFWPSADTWAVSTAGTERLRVDSSGRVGIGSANPAFAKLEVGLSASQMPLDGHGDAVALRELGNAGNNSIGVTTVFANGAFNTPYQGRWRVKRKATAANFEHIFEVAYGTAASNVSEVLRTSNDEFVVSTGGAERLRVDSSGRVGIGAGTGAVTAALDINSDKIRLRTAKTPASASDTGNAGDICWDANYVYVCVATNTWKRSALSTW